MALSDFFDRLGTNIANAPPDAWFALSDSLINRKGLAGGLNAFAREAQAGRKRQGMADALQGMMGDLTPQQGAWLNAAGPEAAFSVVGQNLFSRDPLTEMKTRYWKSQLGEPGATEAVSDDTIPPDAPQAPAAPGTPGATAAPVPPPAAVPNKRNNALFKAQAAAMAGDTAGAAYWGEQAKADLPHNVKKTAVEGEGPLRKEYQDQSKSFVKVRDAYNRITSAPSSPAGDLALIYSYVTLLDPDSVVRESEFALAEKARPLLERLGISWDAVSAVWEGKRLPPGPRADFLNSSGTLYNGYERNQTQLEKFYTDTAGSYGFDPKRIVFDYRSAKNPKPPSSPPPVDPSGTSPAASGPLPDDISRLKSNPTPQERKWFDEAFGPGASQRALTPTGPAGGPLLNGPPAMQRNSFNTAAPDDMQLAQGGGVASAPANGLGMAPPQTLAQIGQRGPTALSPQMADIENARGGIQSDVLAGDQKYRAIITKLKNEWKRDKAKVLASPEYKFLQQTGLLHLLELGS